MKVSDLISLLEECDPEAEVRLMTQQNYPFEHRVLGVATRAEMDDSDTCECNVRPGRPHDELCAAFEEEECDHTPPSVGQPCVAGRHRLTLAKRRLGSSRCESSLHLISLPDAADLALA